MYAVAVRFYKRQVITSNIPWPVTRWKMLRCQCQSRAKPGNKIPVLCSPSYEYSAIKLDPPDCPCYPALPSTSTRTSLIQSEMRLQGCNYAFWGSEGRSFHRNGVRELYRIEIFCDMWGVFFVFIYILPTFRAGYVWDALFASFFFFSSFLFLVHTGILGCGFYHSQTEHASAGYITG